MIKSITLVVDNDPYLLALFTALTTQVNTPWELGELYKQMLCGYLDADYIAVGTGSAARIDGSYEPIVFLFQSILESSINSIPESDWQVLASHYLNKAAQP